ncbi:MAG: K(+)-transporting ATPase subunit C [Chitinophagales bacterium]|nr:K(+)-transporting ATPase subunit C [Chitinophagales bacterium]
MKSNIFPALKLTAICILLFSGLYTLLIWGMALVIAPNHGKGEAVVINGHKVGYALIGQKFTDDKYFWSRPSAVDYNAASSCGSNKGPSNPDYLLLVQGRVDTFLAHNPTVKKEDIPSELVTASGSGLDPDLSPKAATIQIARIARLRNISEQKVATVVNNNTQKPLLGLFGPAKVNVLKLNIELDNLK